jgi:2-oxoglutarate dehydrogenase E2 component (dihydrolipoamide succinyltransferase)
MMADQRVDPSTVTGTGRGGRILKEDVAQTVAARAARGDDARGAAGGREAAAPKPPSAGPVHGEQRVPMSRLRARIAERLVQSQSTAAILTTFNEVNMQPVIDLRNRYKDRFEKEHGVKLGFMGFFVKAAVHAKVSARQCVDRRRRHHITTTTTSA